MEESIFLRLSRMRLSNTGHLKLKTVIKQIFLQKILGFNRAVPWPVHWSTTVTSPEKIIPGTRSPGLSKMCHLDGRNGIIIGQNVWIGPHVKIISMNHDVNDYEQYTKTQPIKIGDDCWIGAGATILPGVELGRHTIVAAGAIVTRSFIDENQVLAGVPAKVVKKLPAYHSRG
jgi:acetyltransferase-like isoleucine patch superfamily enzyme